VGTYVAPVGIKGKSLNIVTLFTTHTSSEMESVIDYEFLSGSHGEEVIKENASKRSVFFPLPHGGSLALKIGIILG